MADNQTTVEQIERVRQEARRLDYLGWRSPRGSLIRTSYFDRACHLWSEVRRMEDKLQENPHA